MAPETHQLNAFQPRCFNCGTCRHSSQSPSLVETGSASLFVSAAVIPSLKKECGKKLVARGRWHHPQSRGVLSCRPWLSPSQDKHARPRVLSVPATDGKSIHSAAIHGLAFWSSSSHVWKRMELYVIAVSDSRIKMFILYRDRFSCRLPFRFFRKCRTWKDILISGLNICQ